MGKILVVDDAAVMRMRYSALVTEAGHEVVEAGNGEEAVALYAAESPNLVLMDITMPVMDGIEATRMIRQLDPTAKVVIVSAVGQQAMVSAAIAAGALDFIVKPFQPERIRDAIARFLR